MLHGCIHSVSQKAYLSRLVDSGFTNLINITLPENPYLSIRNPYLSRMPHPRIREDYTPMIISSHPLT